MRGGATLIALLISQAAHAGPPELVLPVDCALGETCYIQNYVDADESAAYRDFACGALSYNGHKGTDFAVPTHQDAMQGVNVLAAAAGQVTGVRDAVPDQFMRSEMHFPEGQDCGNGVVIRHADGWETQYCHLTRGSITVGRGDQVEAGTVLGTIGMSGRTEFPHLHLSLRKDGAVVDPFDPQPDETCGAPPEEQLWRTPLDYEAGDLLEAGFAAAVPAFEDVKFGTAHRSKISSGQGALVVWAFLYGTKPGDQLQMQITGPNGLFFEHTETLERPQAQVMRAGGRRLHAENTVPGRYRGLLVFNRDGVEIGRLTTETVLRD